MLHNYKSSFFSSLLILLFCTFNIYAQLEGELIPFSQTYPGPNDPSIIRGDMKVIGNSILGILDTVEDENGVDRTYTPNESYFGFSRNNGVYRGYIDIDSDASFNSVFAGVPNSEKNYSGATNIYGSPTTSSFSDTGTFSSSAAELSISNPSSPVGVNCSKVVKAFLYWGAMYGRESIASNDTDGDNIDRPDCTRPNGDDCEFYTDIKILPPGATEYVDIKYDNSGLDHNSLKSEVIIDGLDGRVYSFSETETVRDEIYACVADVTSLFTYLQDQDENIEGNWTVANLRATTGRKSTGSGGGWSLIVVYEDPLATFQKNIYMFEGYVAITRSDSQPLNGVEFNISGFETIPFGPVNVDIATIALEGDIGIYGDQLQINEENDDHTKSNNWIPLYYTGSDPNNFYDSSIYSKGSVTRYPNSSNTLGYDSDHFQLTNPSNDYVSNSDNEADFRIYTEGDAFGNFFNAFAIEVIAPRLDIIKKVYKSDGSEFAENEEVGLGDEIEYEITITNNGNDNVVDVEFTDALPTNTVFTNTEINLEGIIIPNNDVTITDIVTTNIITGLNYETKQINFDIADELLEIGKSVVIQFKVEVVSDCRLLQDACSNAIENLALVSYFGSTNNNNGQKFETLSAYDTDACGSLLVGSTTLLIDASVCENQVEIISQCSEFAELKAGEGFVEYQWFYDGNRITTNADGTSINSIDNIITINQSGTYTVNQIKNTSDSYSYCTDVTLTFEVEIYNPLSPPPNPFENFGEPLYPICSDDGTVITEILLCDNSSAEIIPNFQDATIYSWQKYDETLGCTQSSENCPYYSPSVFNCYTEVSDSPTYNLTDEGAYKLSVIFSGGCQFDYFFEASENCPVLSNPELEKEAANITIYPLPAINTVTINNASSLKMESIEVYNITGELLITESTELNKETLVDISDLKAGVYITKINTEKGKIIKKFVKK